MQGSGAQKGSWCEMLEGEQKDYETRSSKETSFKASLPYNVKVIPGDTSIGITEHSLLQHLDFERIGFFKKSYQDVRHVHTDFSSIYFRETGSLGSCPEGISLFQKSKHSLPSFQDL